LTNVAIVALHQTSVNGYLEYSLGNEMYAMNKKN